MGPACVVRTQAGLCVACGSQPILSAPFVVQCYVQQPLLVPRRVGSVLLLPDSYLWYV